MIFRYNQPVEIAKIVLHSANHSKTQTIHPLTMPGSFQQNNQTSDGYQRYRTNGQGHGTILLHKALYELVIQLMTIDCIPMIL